MADVTDVQPAPAPSSAAVELVGATLLEGLGDYSFPVTTSNPEAQRWFNQGLMLAYGFNHDAAERSFIKATELDPGCAMCWWGASLVLGPHVNSGMEPSNNAKAWSRLQTAVALAPKATEREQAFIQALSARYAENPPEDRRPLDEAYAASTGQLAAARPDDLDAAVFHAEAMMNLQPWDYLRRAAATQGQHRRNRLRGSSRSWRATPTTRERCTCTCTRSRHPPTRSAEWPLRTTSAN